MKKIVSVLSLILLSTLFSFAQKEANVWYFGGYAGLDFNSGTPVALSNSSMDTNEGCASISDKNTGQILFYTDGDVIYNRNHSIMTNGSGLLGDFSSSQSAVVIPMPGSSTLFYVFTADAQVGELTGNQGKFCYNIVDMSLSGGLGSVTTKNIVLKTNMVEKIAAVRACNGQDIWVIAHEWNSNAFYAYKVTTSGISAPVVSNSGIFHQDIDFSGNAESIGTMKTSPDGKKLALACYYALNTVQIFNFDNATGIISNPITDTNFPDQSFGFFANDGPYGISFSPDNSKLYVGVFGNYSEYGVSYIYQYNMNAGSNGAILASRTTIRTNYNESYGSLQIGPNGKIYVAKTNDIGSGYLDVINNPNALGAACNYVSDGQYLGGLGSSVFGLPCLIESFLSVPHTATLTYSDCTGNKTLSFTDNSLNGSIGTSWNFGDPASGSANTSNLQNPTHTFSSGGSYTVSVYFTTACQVDSFKQTITVGGGLTGVTAGPDTTVCANDFVQMHATGGTSYKWSPGTGLSDSTSADPFIIPPVSSTTYTVTITNSGCSTTENVTINASLSPPTPTITLSHDTLYCSYDASYTSYQWYDNSALVNGATKTFFIATHDGNYNVSVKNEFGCAIAVGINVLFTGVNNYADDYSISLSPNPATNELFINGNWANGKSTMVIYNVIGEKVYSDQLLTLSPKLQAKVDVRNLARGIYFLKLEQADGSKWVGKFVKE